MTSSNQNTLDQAIDIRGSDTQSSSMISSEETLGLGRAISGQTGIAASIIVGANVVVSGLTGMSILSVGRFLTISEAATSSNNGTFPITAFNSSTSVNITNGSATTDGHNGALAWIERNAYSLEDDLNYERTDRAAIKGVGFSSGIPTYEKSISPTVNTPTNLVNIAGKTTDAKTLIANERFENITVSTGILFKKITGTFPYAKTTNYTGIPINDGYDAGNEDATYVGIFADGYESGLFVQSGAHIGERIFGRTRKGSTGVDGTSVEIEFRSVVKNTNISTSSSYSWESELPTIIDIFYPYRYSIDQIPEDSFRYIINNGYIQEYSAESGSGSSTVDFNDIILDIDGSITYVGDGDILLKI